MEIKQLEYFVTVAELGSTNRAAEALYTSQPNVSKVLSTFEKNIGCSVFDRTNKGVTLTTSGEKLYEYAKVVLKNIHVMANIANESVIKKFSISCYPSHMISRIFCDFYNSRKENDLRLEFLEGTVEEITENVEKHLSEIGIVYIAKSQEKCFRHILEHKKLEFNVLAEKEACIYMGKNNPLYENKSIPFSELPKLKFVQPAKDFFSMEHHLEYISLGALCMNNLQNVVDTNSDNLLIDLLLSTDICSMGIRYMDPKYEQYDIATIEIEDCDKCLVLGYIKPQSIKLSENATLFIDMFNKSLQKCE